MLLPNTENTIITGKLVKPFGLKGEIVFLSYSGEIAHLQHVTSFYLTCSKQYKTLEYWVGLEKADSSSHISTSKIRCKIIDVDSPETAKLLCGQNVSILRKDAPILKEQEWFIADIISLYVSCNGKRVGQIEAVSQDPAQPLLRIQWNNQSIGFIPFNKYFFASPNLDAHSVELLNESLIEHN